MNPRVISVVANPDYTLTISFNNGETRIYDCSPHLNFGVFSELKNLGYFKMASVSNGTVAWPNEQDICPDTLYLDSILYAAAV